MKRHLFPDSMEIYWKMETMNMLKGAAESVKSLQNLTDREVSQILCEVATALREATAVIMNANVIDLARMSQDNPKYDRLKLSPQYAQE